MSASNNITVIQNLMMLRLYKHVRMVKYYVLSQNSEKIFSFSIWLSLRENGDELFLKSKCHFCAVFPSDLFNYFAHW